MNKSIFNHETSKAGKRAAEMAKHGTREVEAVTSKA